MVGASLQGGEIMLGYLNTPVFASHHIPVGSGHTLYVEEAGNPTGCPVVFLHGGQVGRLGSHPGVSSILNFIGLC